LRTSEKKWLPEGILIVSPKQQGLVRLILRSQLQEAEPVRRNDILVDPPPVAGTLAAWQTKKLKISLTIATSPF
jgi:hypothetical protein